MRLVAVQAGNQISMALHLSVLPLPLLLLLLGVSSLDCVAALTSKCVTKRDNRVTLSCPEGHVIAHPIVLAGAGNATSCFPRPGDCRGLTTRLLTQRNKCYWKRWCELSWSNKFPIVQSEERPCLGLLPSYLAVDRVLCVPQGSVHSVWGNELELSREDVGVIRSHEAYPWTYSTIQTGEHRKIIREQAGRALRLVVEDVDLEPQHGDRLVLTHLTSFHEQAFFNASQSDRREFLVPTGDVIVLFYVNSGTRTSGRGFLLRYEFLSEVEVDAGLQRQVADLSTQTDLVLPQSPTKHAVLEECITRKQNHFTIGCPPGHVIYRPEVSVGVSNHGYCRHMSSDCTGHLHTLLSEKNNCYWRQSCDVSWSGGIPITLSPHPHCLALTPNYVSVHQHACVKEDQVFNICNQTLSFVNATSGLLVSHDTYPWHHPSQKTVCRVLLPVHRTLGLRLSLEDVDLDPDSKGDNLKIWQHGRRGRRRRLVEKVQGDRSVEDLTFQDGCLRVEFRVSRNSKAGRGFVLRFSPAILTTGPVTPQFHDCPTLGRGGGAKGRKRGKKRRVRKGSKGYRQGGRKSGKSKTGRRRISRKRQARRS